MSHVYKVIDIVGSSPSSIEDAIQQAIARTSDTINNVEWFQVDQVRGHVQDGKVGHYQVAIKIGFRLDEA